MEAVLSREMVGRARERALVEGLVSRTAEGIGETLLLVGEAGIGKSRLRREAERSARHRGLLVLSGRAVDGGASTPFRPLAEALTRGFPAAGPPNDPAISGLRTTLAHLVPQWARQPSPHTSVLAIAEAVLRLLEAAGRESGALLVVEDAHWADGDTLAVLEYLADNVPAHRSSLLATLRSEPPTGALAIGRGLAERRAATLVEVGPLVPREVDALVRSCLDDDALPAELLAFVRERADGNPFYAEELLGGLMRAGALAREDGDWRLVGSRLTSAVPQTLAEAVERRLASLRPAARQTVLAAALLGRRFDWRLLTRVTGLAEEAVLAALQEAVRAHLLVGDADTLRFRHALTREHVLKCMLPPERAALGERALDAVQRAHPQLDGDWCDLAAELAAISGHHDRAVRCLLMSASRARDCGALANAVARLDKAAALAEAGSDLALRVDEQLAEVLALAGDVDGALERGHRALSTRPQRPRDAEREFDLTLTLAQALLAAGRHEHAREYAYRAGRQADGLGQPHRIARASGLSAQIAAADGDLRLALRLADETLTEAPEDAPAVRCAALEVIGRCRRVQDVDGAEQAFAEALEVATAHGLSAWRARALHELGTIDLLDTMRTDRLESARVLSIEAGTLATAALADFHRAAALVASGQPSAGRDAAQRAARLARRLGHAVAPWALMVVARSYAHERDRAAMEAAIAESLAAGPDDPALEATAWGQVRAMLALHLADRDTALDSLDRAASLLRARPEHHDPHRGLWALLRAAADEAPMPAIAEAASAAGSGTRFNRSLLRAARGVQAGRMGERRAAAEELRACVDLLRGYRGADWLIHLTRWICAPAALADEWGEPVDWLQEGVRWFPEHGHEPLAASSRVLLRAAGATVPRRGRGTSSVPSALQASGVTSREVDVLRLVVEGLSNREIAERLTLSPRTVEKHVARLLDKTGAADRRGLEGLTGSLREASLRP